MGPYDNEDDAAHADYLYDLERDRELEDRDCPRLRDAEYARWLREREREIAEGDL